MTAAEVAQDRIEFGNVLKTFVFGEQPKHTTTAEADRRRLSACVQRCKLLLHEGLGLPDRLVTCQTR